MAELNWADYLLIAVLGVSTVVSLFRGFFKEALSLAGWMVSLWIAWKAGPAASGMLESSVEDLQSIAIHVPDPLMAHPC